METTPKYDSNVDKQRQCSTTKHVGCKFAVKLICLDDTNRHIEI